MRDADQRLSEAILADHVYEERSPFYHDYEDTPSTLPDRYVVIQVGKVKTTPRKASSNEHA